MSTDVILGLASGYPEGVYHRFLGSLRDGGYGGRVVLFMDGEPGRTVADTCGRYGAEVVSFEGVPYQLLCYRFLLYGAWISQNAARTLGRVLLTDVNDVVFQGDVFAYPMPVDADIYYFAEHFKIGRCRNNSAWIRHYCGPETLANLIDKPIICAGTTFGTADAIAAYIRAINSRITECLRSGKSIGCGEQGLHNHLAYGGCPEGFRTAVLDNEDGPIYTVGSLFIYMNRIAEVLSFSRDGRITRLDGEAPPLVHQINRMNKEQLDKLCGPHGWSTEGLL